MSVCVCVSEFMCMICLREYILYSPGISPSEFSTRRGPKWGGGLLTNSQFTSNISLGQWFV